MLFSYSTNFVICSVSLIVDFNCAAENINNRSVLDGLSLVVLHTLILIKNRKTPFTSSIHISILLKSGKRKHPLVHKHKIHL